MNLTKITPETNRERILIMENNHTQVSQGFRALLGALAPYMARELESEFGANWWDTAVMGILYDNQKSDLPTFGDTSKLVDSLDIARCFLLFDLHWQKVFRKKLSIDHRTWAKELVGVRNRLAHMGGEDFSDDDTWRALDTMSRLSEQIDPDGAEEIRSLLRKSRYGTASASTTASESFAIPATKIKNIGVLDTAPTSGL
ncbi:MAG: Swt1 family HEPN domain-containing protein, partial [Oscillospiraceae bacterium]|nr:Swt1 family HEPN domain-containing protein [Oscillospiraceae bacterium]